MCPARGAKRQSSPVAKAAKMAAAVVARRQACLPAVGPPPLTGSRLSESRLATDDLCRSNLLSRREWTMPHAVIHTKAQIVNA